MTLLYGAKQFPHTLEPVAIHYTYQNWEI
jgi:hypothetical protein